MGKMNWTYTPVDTTQGIWFDMKVDELGKATFSLIVAGESIKVTESQYFAFQDYSRQAIKDARASERGRVLSLLHENLDRFDYSNNQIDPLSFTEFAMMCQNDG